MVKKVWNMMNCIRFVSENHVFTCVLKFKFTVYAVTFWLRNLFECLKMNNAENSGYKSFKDAENNKIKTKYRKCIQ